MILSEENTWRRNKRQKPVCPETSIKSSSFLMNSSNYWLAGSFLLGFYSRVKSFRISFPSSWWWCWWTHRRGSYRDLSRVETIQSSNSYTHRVCVTSILFYSFVKVKIHKFTLLRMRDSCLFYIFFVFIFIFCWLKLWIFTKNNENANWKEGNHA